MRVPGGVSPGYARCAAVRAARSQHLLHRWPRLHALVANTVARGMLREDEHLYQGKIDGQLTDSFPMPVTAEVMARGRERFDVFCAPCHGRTGQGNGMVVQRGFRAPPSFHEERLRTAPVGYFFDVQTNGFGAMADYSAQVPVADRWAIAALHSGAPVQPARHRSATCRRIAAPNSTRRRHRRHRDGRHDPHAAWRRRRASRTRPQGRWSVGSWPARSGSSSIATTSSGPG